MPKLPFAEIADFVACFVGVSAERLSSSTTLFGDLGVDGQDGIDLFVAFGKRFYVDLSALDTTRHFGAEGFGPRALLHWVVLWLRAGTPEEKARLSPVTIADLQRAAESGRWSYGQ